MREGASKKQGEIMGLYRMRPGMGQVARSSEREADWKAAMS